MAATGVHTPGRRSAPLDPKSEDLLALATHVARSTQGSATGSLTEGLPQVPTTRDRRDRCPGALRPWPAEDGLLVRLRLIGGRVRSSQLVALVEFAETYGDGRVHLTSRANLQVRGLSGVDGALGPEVLAALVATGLLPSASHELVRNVMVSPQTGLAGGYADLRPVAAELDRLLCADERLAELPGRFLFVLDDGRGDLLERSCDLGLVALDSTTAQLRVGDGWGATVPLAEAAAQIIGLAHRFLDVRGDAATAAWHAAELDRPLTPASSTDSRVPMPTSSLPFGPVPGGWHVPAEAAQGWSRQARPAKAVWSRRARPAKGARPTNSAGLDRDAVLALTHDVPEVIVTPWQGVLVPEENSHV